MKKVFILPVLLVVAMGASAQTKTGTTTKKPVAKPAAKPVSKPSATVAGSTVALKTVNDSISYAFGISLAEFLKSQGVSTISYPMLNLAISQSLKQQKTLLDANQANMVIGQMAEKKREQASGEAKLAGTKFLTENKNKPGVIETASGLQYEIIKQGTGPKPTATDTVMAHYKGMLLNGEEFDNSYSRGEPISIPVNQVIPGWTEALQMMPVGSKWKLYIPSSIGYGDFGAGGGQIPGGATLVFEVELLEIVGNKNQ